MILNSLTSSTNLFTGDDSKSKQIAEIGLDMAPLGGTSSFANNPSNPFISANDDRTFGRKGGRICIYLSNSTTTEHGKVHFLTSTYT